MIKNLWIKISQLGFNDDQSDLDKRMLTLSNRINLSLGVLMLFIFIYVVSISVWDEIGMGTLRLSFIFIICSINLVLAYFGFVQLSKLSLTIVVPFFVLLFNVLVSDVTNEYFTWYPYAAIALSIIPWLIYSNEKEKKALVVSVIYIGIFALFMDRILLSLSNKDLQIITILNEFYVFYKLSHIAIYIFLNLTFLYLLKINREYQEKLEKTNRILVDQSHEITEQANHLKDANKELEKLSIVASKTDNAIAILNPEGKVEWVNEGFTRLYEYKFDELISKKGDNFIDMLESAELKEKYLECIKSVKSNICQSTITTKSGKILWRQTTLTPIINAEGKIKNLIAIDSDITPLKDAEAKIHNLVNEIEKQRDLAIEQHEEITDSIHYAKRIQRALMPSEKRMNNILKEYFIINYPKSIVSGDFYWITRKGNLRIIAMADCTGHGVSGAFMSIIGTHLLDNIINRNNVTKPSEILKVLNRKLKILLLSKEDSYTNDGMDIAIIAINDDENSFEFAGAMRPVIFFRENELLHLKGDYIQVSSDINVSQVKAFTNQKEFFNKGDILYMFSDGIVDQFGGEKGKKLLINGFKQWLIDIYHLPMEEQKNVLTSYFINWLQDSYEQIDDIFVMGIRF